MVGWIGDSVYTARAVRDLAEAEQAASEVLLAAGLSKPPVPENIVAFCDSGRPVRIFRRRLGAMHGLLEPNPFGWIIIVNKDFPRSAQRFSVAHEGFHILQRSRDLLCYGPGEYQEFLADGFAARLLMPAQWVTGLWSKHSDPGLMAYIFRVSRTAMDKRLKELCLVESTDGY